MIDGSEKPNRQLGFELQSSHVIENRNIFYFDLEYIDFIFLWSVR